MAATLSTGSPKLGKKPSSNFVILDQNEDDGKAAVARSVSQVSVSRASPAPLQAGMLGNSQPKTKVLKLNLESRVNPKPGNPSDMENLLARMQEMQVKDNQQSSSSARPAIDHEKLMVKLMADLKAQNGELKRQELESKGESDSDFQKEEDRSSASEPFTPATESFDAVVASNLSATEILRVKQELATAKSVITRQEQELAESRNLKHTIDQAMGPASEADFGNRADMNEETIQHLQGAFNAATATARPFAGRADSWHPQEDSRSDNSDGLSAGNYNRGRGIWNGPSQPTYGANFAQSLPQQTNIMDSRNAFGAWPPMTGVQAGQGAVPATQRVFSGPSAPTYGFEGRFGFGDDGSQFNPGGMRRTTSQYTQYNRPTPGYNNRAGPFGGGLGAGLALTTSPMNPMGFGAPLPYQPRPIGSPLSPTASEFSTSPLPNLGNAWSQTNNAAAQTYVTPLEPMNYRRLLDKSVSCDWKYIVDKIVCSNDQQASIFLQQKLKVGTAEQKYEIVEAIVNQAYPLMINRFGNFLVQRCFEHGTPDQVIAIANAIHGSVLSLSMDAFGCHVVQKAFDSVPENHKADMVRELLRRIPDTVIHRYACHVWQKLFELRWNGEPPQIMIKVNEALRGMWHEVALGETGSLVVQNIFENCVEEEKRPAIEEVIASIDLIAHGQFGNWCIQHLCEHGSPPDKRRVIDHILANAYSYSIDQFASKVVEKCLKIGGVEFMDRYLGVVTTAHPERPRIPLIDISGDQYGNYLVQWILMNTHHHQREQVANHIRKHMVSLRGSKFGSRVAMLCCNPASVTRPGPGVIVNPFGAPGQPRGGPWGRYR